MEYTRDQKWLENTLGNIWADHFHDVEPNVPLMVKFGRNARTRLGSISYDTKQKIAVIRITGLFKDNRVPENVIRATLVHELIHYAHGFHGVGRPNFDHPHRGGVIRKEFIERGLEELYVAQKRWLKANWTSILKDYYPNLKFKH